MSQNKPKILLIDWFNTLSSSKFWGHWESQNNKKFKKIEKYLFGSPNVLANNWMSGKLNSESAIKEISKNLNIDYKDLYDDFVISCKEMKFVNKKIPSLIKKIKKDGNIVYIFSDNMDSLERWTAPSLKLENVFDSIINSFNVKFLKNQVDEKGQNYFLEEALKISGGDLKDFVLFDDNINTINLFDSLGIRTNWVSKDYPLTDYLENFNKQQ